MSVTENPEDQFPCGTVPADGTQQHADSDDAWPLLCDAGAAGDFHGFSVFCIAPCPSNVFGFSCFLWLGSQARQQLHPAHRTLGKHSSWMALWSVHSWPHTSTQIALNRMQRLSLQSRPPHVRWRHSFRNQHPRGPKFRVLVMWQVYRFNVHVFRGLSHCRFLMTNMAHRCVSTFCATTNTDPVRSMCICCCMAAVSVIELSRSTDMFTCCQDVLSAASASKVHVERSRCVIL